MSKLSYYLRFIRGRFDNWGVIGIFLKNNLRIRLHKDKTKIISLSRGVDFVGFRNFYYFKLLRKRNIKKMLSKLELCYGGDLALGNIFDSFIGWRGFAMWGNSYRLREDVKRMIIDIICGWI